MLHAASGPADELCRGLAGMYANMNGDERDAGCVHSSDQYIIDEKWFFIRGCLEIPILRSNDIFLWALWASVRGEVFNNVSECWELASREITGNHSKARLANSLSPYPPTMNFKVKMVLHQVGESPPFAVEEGDTSWQSNNA